MLFFIFLVADRKIVPLPEKIILPDSGGCSAPAHTPMTPAEHAAAGPDERLQ